MFQRTCRYLSYKCCVIKNRLATASTCTMKTNSGANNNKHDYNVLITMLYKMLYFLTSSLPSTIP